MQVLPATPDVGVKEFKVRIAAIVPCYNEEAAVGTVVTDLKNAVPGIEVYVYDNNSSDRTAEVAAAAGAIVRTETRKGKGNVVRRAFADIDADVYVMIDGDDTYPTLCGTGSEDYIGTSWAMGEFSGWYQGCLHCREGMWKR